MHLAFQAVDPLFLQGGFEIRKRLEEQVMDRSAYCKKNTKELIYCELHLKLIYDDRNVYSQNRRIYFHEGKPNIQKGKILIGHIGEHL